MADRSNKRKKRPAGGIPLATPFVDQVPILDEAPVIDPDMDDVFFEQPLVEEGKKPASMAAGRPGELRGGKARATKLGKAKLSAIAKKVTRSRWKKKR
jgi:hypothetical protein